jgi:hypothetical protein
MVKFAIAIAFHCLANAVYLPASVVSLITSVWVVGIVVSPPLLGAARNFPTLA